MTVATINVVDGSVADGTSIPIVTRSGWGCDERLRFRRKTECWLEMYVPTNKVVLHHTVTTNAYVNGAGEVRAIYTYHKVVIVVVRQARMRSSAPMWSLVMCTATTMAAPGSPARRGQEHYSERKQPSGCSKIG